MKRSRYKIIGPANLALKNMRNARGMSIRNLAKVMGVKATTINHYENGRVEKISEGYIHTFLEALNYSSEDWNDLLEGKVTVFDIERRCVKMLKGLEKNKLQSIHSLLESFLK